MKIAAADWISTITIKCRVIKQRQIAITSPDIAPDGITENPHRSSIVLEAGDHSIAFVAPITLRDFGGLQPDITERQPRILLGKALLPDTTVITLNQPQSVRRVIKPHSPTIGMGSGTSGMAGINHTVAGPKLVVARDTAIGGKMDSDQTSGMWPI